MSNWKTFFTTTCFLYCLYYLSNLNSWHLIDNVNLMTHEAGHLVFMLFGYFLTILGGTLMQLLVPIIFIGYFVIKKQNFSASIILYWLAINLYNVSVYAGDALKMQLPLLTGDKESHDWNQILFTLGWLRHTEFISHFILGLGLMVLILALIWGLYESRKPVPINNIS